MKPSKTGGPLKTVFDPGKREAAAVILTPATVPTIPETMSGGSSGRNRKAGGRNVRISGYIPPEIDAALRDEVVRRTTAERRSVSYNDVLCDVLAAWAAQQDTQP